MYNSAGQFSTFVENFFPRGRLFRPSRRGPSAPSSVNEPALGPSAPPWPWQVGRCIWVLARGADVFSPVALASAIMYLLTYTTYLTLNWGGGCSPKKNQKKTSRYTKIVKLALVFLFFFGFFWFFLNFQIGIGFFWFFLVFFGIGFGQNSKLETGFFCFFWFFLVFFWFFFGFFGIGLGQYSKLETGFLGSVGFFWFFLVFFWDFSVFFGI